MALNWGVSCTPLRWERVPSIFCFSGWAQEGSDDYNSNIAHLESTEKKITYLTLSAPNVLLEDCDDHPSHHTECAQCRVKCIVLSCSNRCSSNGVHELFKCCTSFAHSFQIPSGSQVVPSCPKWCPSVVAIVPKWCLVFSIYVTIRRDVLSECLWSFSSV